MKGLRKYLTPFAPDQSGAVAALYDLGGMIVICDAGGCAGNICGFDEPRWEHHKSAIFSAGLRDMDAIMGRDAEMVKKIADAADRMEVNFIALIGTPVLAVIGTDYGALSRMLRKRTGLPVLCIDTNGMELYDRGEEKAYLELFRTFAIEPFPVVPGRVNVIGEALGADHAVSLRSAAPQEKDAGRPDPFSLILYASEAEKNIAASPSAVSAAKLLAERFGTPYEVMYPGAKAMLDTALAQSRETDGMRFAGCRVLIVHQHVLADSLRREVLSRGAADVTAATWFSFAEQIRRPEDVFLKEEDDFTTLVKDGGYDVILADRALKPLAPSFSGIWIDLPHFALSGRHA